jgi:hypothetical protein
MMVRDVTTSTLESDALVCKTTDSYQLIHFHKSNLLKSTKRKTLPLQNCVPLPSHDLDF